MPMSRAQSTTRGQVHVAIERRLEPASQCRQVLWLADLQGYQDVDV